MYSFAEFISVQLTLIEANNCIFLSVHIYSPDILLKTRKCDPGANQKPHVTVEIHAASVRGKILNLMWRRLTLYTLSSFIDCRHQTASYLSANLNPENNIQYSHVCTHTHTHTNSDDKKAKMMRKILHILWLQPHMDEVSLKGFLGLCDMCLT